MRKLIILIFLFVFPYILFAQSSFFSSKIIRGVGIKPGITFGGQYFDPKFYSPTFDSNVNVDYSLESRIGINVSLFVEFLKNRSFSLIAEIGYNQKIINEAYVITGGISPEKVSGINQFDYISLVIPCKIRKTFKHFTPYFLLGHRFDFLVSTNIITSNKISLNTTNYGLSLGFGVEIPRVLPFLLLVEYRFNPDFTNAYETNLVKSNNMTSEITIGININDTEIFKKKPE